MLQSHYNKPRTDVSIANDKQQGDNQNDDSSDIALGELDNLLASMSSKDIISDTLKEPESSKVTTNVEYVYIFKPTISKKDVRNELAIGYTEEFVNLNFLPRLIYNACSGCKNGIEMFTDMAILMFGSVTLQEKVAAFLKNRNAVFN